MSQRATLLLIIFLEGYVVLSAELLAIRLLIPFVGSGTETIAIIIAAVLMPLAFGYYYGGKYHYKIGNDSVREKIRKNMLISLKFLTVGLTYLFLHFFFSISTHYITENNVVQAAIYSAIFLAYPVFLLGQTVPLITNYFRGADLSKTTGIVLFFSTVGSFLGATLSTLLFMAFLGVHITVIITLTIIGLIILLLSRNETGKINISTFVILATAIFFNTYGVKALNISSNNQYNTVVVYDVEEEEDSRIMNINRSNSSKISADRSQMFHYLQYLENNFLKPMTEKEEIQNILVIGAGGFTVGIDDAKSNYVFVDIDPELKNISEKYFLKQKLGENKKFVSKPARAFLRENKQKYDLILIDAFTNTFNTPGQLLTEEFLLSVKNTLSEEGIVFVNIIESPFLTTKFSQKYKNTFDKVFANYSRFPITGEPIYNSKDTLTNVLYVYLNSPKPSDDTYTDNLNSFFYDR